MVVDSTRRGKSMPDALSKTIPTWCAVLNEASRRKYGTPQSKTVGFGLETPGWMIPPSEHDQIEARIDGFVSALLESDLEVPKLSKPLKPLFVTPQTKFDTLPVGLQDARVLEYVPMLLVSASQFVADSAKLDAPQWNGALVYVQGAGDDHENWARGLTPDVFWKHQHALLSCGKDELEAMVDSLVAEEKAAGSGTRHWFTPLAPQRMHTAQQDGKAKPGAASLDDVQVSDTGVFIGTRPAGHSFTAEEQQRFGCIIYFTGLCADTDVTDKLLSLDLSDPAVRSRIYPMRMPPNRKGLNAIRHTFPAAIELAHQTLTSAQGSRKAVLICCQDGKDLSGSLVVAVLASCFTDSRQLLPSPAERNAHVAALTKDALQRRLQWLVTANPQSAPSRSFLLRVNELLLSPRHRPPPPAS